MVSGVAHPDSNQAPPVAQVVAELRGCLARLDQLKLRRAGAYVSMAIDVLCLECGLAPDGDAEFA
jgi:hypothetical protein